MLDLLVIDAWNPDPQRDAGSLRIVGLLRILRELSFRVDFAADEPDLRPPPVELFQALGVHMIPEPPSSLKEHLEREGHRYDVVILSRVPVGTKHVARARRHAPNAKIVFDTTDLTFLREIRHAEVTGDDSRLKRALLIKQLELAVARAADVTLVVSPFEEEMLEQECPEAEVHIVSLIHEVHGSARPFDQREGILFVGGFVHHPNADGIRYFCDDVFPRLAEKLDGAKVFIVGSNPPDWLRNAGSDRLIVTGFVPDLTSQLNRCRLSIAPLRFGAGIKGKVLLSMSYGLPVVASSIAAEGIPTIAGQDILIGDDAESFSDQVARLYHDEPLWGQLSVNGLKIVAEHFSFAAVRRQTVGLFKKLGFESV